MELKLQCAILDPGLRRDDEPELIFGTEGKKQLTLLTRNPGQIVPVQDVCQPHPEKS